MYHFSIILYRKRTYILIRITKGGVAGYSVMCVVFFSHLYRIKTEKKIKLHAQKNRRLKKSERKNPCSRHALPFVRVPLRKHVWPWELWVVFCCIYIFTWGKKYCSCVKLVFKAKQRRLSVPWVWLFAIEPTLKSSVESQSKTVGVFVWKTTRLCSKCKSALYKRHSQVFDRAASQIQFNWCQRGRCGRGSAVYVRDCSSVTVFCAFSAVVLNLFEFPINVFYAWEHLLAFQTLKNDFCRLIIFLVFTWMPTN